MRYVDDFVVLTPSKAQAKEALALVSQTLQRLGLHLSLKLAQQLGGTITVQSEYGEGSRFSILLPER